MYKLRGVVSTPIAVMPGLHQSNSWLMVNAGLVWGLEAN